MAPEKTYLVTGASKGLGLAICNLLCEKGYIVIGVARESIELRELEKNLKKQSPKSAVYACDFASKQQTNNLISSIIGDYEVIDGVVHNVGVIEPIKPLTSTEISDWANLLQINLISVQHLTSGIYCLMKNSDRCRVTTISSGAAVNSLHSWSAYCVSKAGLDMWTRCLAEEGKSDNISAISVAPGIVDTGMQQDIRNSNPNDFPMHQRFVDFKEHGDLVAPEIVASQLFELITNQQMEQSGYRFDVREL